MARMNQGPLDKCKWTFDIEKTSNEDSDGIPSSSPLIEDEIKENQDLALLKTEVGEDEQEAKLHPFTMMKKQPRLGINLAIVVLSWIACSFNYFLLSFDIKNLGGNLFLNGSLISFAGVTGKIITMFVRKKFPSKTSIIGCFTVVILFGFGLVFFTEGWLVSV